MTAIPIAASGTRTGSIPVIPGSINPRAASTSRAPIALIGTVSEVFHEGHLVDEFFSGLGQFHESDHQHERGKNSLNDPECNVRINPL
jgi:hypothetical protein